MKTTGETMTARMQGAVDPRSEAALEAFVETMFRRLPALAGFAVCEGAIALADMTCHPAPDEQSLAEMREYITSELLELVDQEPQAALLMCGRTFPRTTH
jgi:hypothetical protein